MRLIKVFARVFFVLFFMSYIQVSFAKEVALTIDDLPFVGSAGKDAAKLRRENERFQRILEVLTKYQVPAIGFVVANSIESGQWEWLEKFKAAGNSLGNHSYSHRSLSRMSTEAYIEDIAKADEKLAAIMSTPKFFRYPFLSDGSGTTKYSAVRDYLSAQHYMVAPVTIDSKDFQFNASLLNIPWRSRAANLDSFKSRYLNYIWNKTVKAEREAEKKEHRSIKHILLIHMNYLNSYFLENIIQLFQSHGYRFITLEEAMKDPYYKPYWLSEVK
ncbi:MAG: polysaccharide deacetylase [Gammaproteobacteria bacterium RIFCSPHIGHO2_12_FULL_41_15]|nr:MAG: polysaccharide deacetylase [Gammaproteobacteria bacterium RIFCSPHIGHO2_12_FULL_41_15]